jgi:hypothetical protein
MFEVRVGAPIATGETDSFICRWELVDDHDTTVVSMCSYGEDSMQALTIALVMLGDRVVAEHSNFHWGDIPGTGLLKHQIEDGHIKTIWWDLPLSHGTDPQENL